MQNVQKNVSKNYEILQKIAVQRNADLKPCRARKMLKNAPTLAIGGADTAENEPPKVRQVSNKIRRNIVESEEVAWAHVEAVTQELVQQVVHERKSVL